VGVEGEENNAAEEGQLLLLMTGDVAAEGLLDELEDLELDLLRRPFNSSLPMSVSSVMSSTLLDDRIEPIRSSFTKMKRAGLVSVKSQRKGEPEITRRSPIMQ
jgi:hypothetical protein